MIVTVRNLKYIYISSEDEVKDSITQIQHSDIFDEVKKQVKAVKTWRKIFKIRNWKIANRNLSSDGRQAHQLSASCTDSSPVTVDSSSLDGDGSTNMQTMLLNVYDLGY